MKSRLIPFGVYVMKREDQIEIIKKLASRDILMELNYLVNLDRDPPIPGIEEEYDLLSAFQDHYQLVDESPSKFPKSQLNCMRDIAIALSWYKPVTDEELENTISTGKGYAWQHRKVKYVHNANS